MPSSSAAISIMAARSSDSADGVFQRLDDGLQSLEPADDLLGLLAIIPEIALAHLAFDRGDLRFLPFEVKESP